MDLACSISRFGIGILCASLIGCSSPPNVSATPNEVMSVLNLLERTPIRDAAKKVDRTVRLQGKIESQVPLIAGARAYELSDETGRIWVTTRDQQMPAPGTRVDVQGKVRYEKISIEGQDQSTIYLEQRGAAEVIPVDQGARS